MSWIRNGFLLGILFWCPASLAAVYVVAPDGSGDFPTIRHAIQAAVDGDVVELLPGTYRGPGNRAIQFHGKAITVRSTSGDPTTCIIDCEEDTIGVYFRENEGRDTILQGVTITRGRSNACGGVQVWPASPTIEDCRFIANTSVNGPGGGAIRVLDSFPLIRNCHFEQNSSGLGGGGIWADANASVDIERCVFTRNFTESPFVSSGAVQLEGGVSSIGNCTFYANESDSGPGAVGIIFGAYCRMVSCTLAENRGTTSTVLVFLDSSATIENSILAFNSASAVQCWDANVQVSCSDIFGNASGDWVSCLASQLGSDGNIQADPQFCGFPDDWSIYSSSPCAPENSNGCGGIGAYPVGCDVVPVIQSSWGGVKSRFR